MSAKDRRGNFLEDFHLGKVFRHATPRTLTDGDRSLFIGLTGSRAAACCSEKTALAMGFPSAPIEDLLVFNVAFGKTVTDVSFNGRANLGYADVIFLKPAYVGDTIEVRSEVIGLKENSSGKDGIVYVRSTVRNQRSEEILRWVRWVIVRKRDGDSPSPSLHVPELPDAVPPAALAVGYFPSASAAIAEATAKHDFWEDYAVGERINHPLAMTINDSDHVIATRLYQNTASAHFDDVIAKGKRLVYGGHVMSICKSLAYDGLENNLGILAINSGTHVAPTYAHDTISCATMVIDKFDLTGPVCALRLRTIASKSAHRATEIPFPASGRTGPASAEGVVLDLDYTVAMPRTPAIGS